MCRIDGRPGLWDAGPRSITDRWRLYMVKFTVEYTDTFGGEANYCWVKRSEFTLDGASSRMVIIRKAKALMGLSGVKGRLDDYGDSYAFRPYRSATVMFVNTEY